MKKGSTAAAKQSRNFSQQKLTIGLDLGDRTSWYCVLDEVGEIVLEQSRHDSESHEGRGTATIAGAFLKSKNEIPATKVNMATF
jgi:hypothetical protein